MNDTPNHSWLTRLVVAFLLVSAFIIGFETILGLLSFRDVGYPDSATIMRVTDFLRGGHIYPDSVNRPPYYVTLYGPFTYLIFAIPIGLAQAVGVDPMLPARLTILAAFCTCIFLVFLITRRISDSRQAPWLAVLFALSSYTMAPWSTEIRGDFWAILFSLSAVYFFLRFNERPQAALTAIPAGIAILVKQTFVAAPLAIVAWLIYRRRFKEAIYWAGIFALVVAGGYTLTWLHEPLMGQHLAAIRHPLYEIRGALHFTSDMLAQLLTPFAAIGALLIFTKRTPQALLLAFYWIASWFIAFTTIFHIGATINYYFEVILVSAILAGPALSELQRRASETPLAARALIAVLLLGWCIPMLREEQWALRNDISAIRSYRSRKASFQAFASLIKGHRFLAYYPDITILSSQPMLPDPWLNTILEKEGHWSYRPVIDNMEHKDFEFIVMTPYFNDGFRGVRPWSSPMVQSFEANYHLACVFQDMHIWMPNGVEPDMLSKLNAVGCQRPDSAAQSARPVVTGL